MGDTANDTFVRETCGRGCPDHAEPLMSSIGSLTDSVTTFEL
jgi:hypothetical protein